MTGEHTRRVLGDEPEPPVPVLEDDGFRLTETSAILKYLADKIDSPRTRRT